MTGEKIRLAIVGVGKIVRDQHLPSIEKSGAYELRATASRNACVDGVTAYRDIESMLAAEPELDAVSLCTPPQYRFDAAKLALNEGLDVLLEKPPGASVCEVEQLASVAEQNDCRLYTTWHSRHGAAVEQAKALLAELEIQSVSVRWKEDVKKWHPGQEWIWQAGGLGVFDPGINGLSILTHVLPESFYVQQASLSFPSNKAAPIASSISFRSVSGIPIQGEFDWRITGDEEWNIDVLTSRGKVSISHGGDQLTVDGVAQPVPGHSEHGEYEAIYANFADVVNNQQSAVDLEPLKLVADAFLLGDRVIVEPFEE